MPITLGRSLILQARETVLQAHRIEKQAWERLTRAKSALQQIREDGKGHLVELHIFRDRFLE